MTLKKTSSSSASSQSENAPARSGALAPLDEMDRLFDAFFSPRWPRLRRWAYPDLVSGASGKMPAVDLIDRNNDVVVRAEIPGAKKEDIDVSVAGNLLTLHAHSQHEEEKEEGEYYRREITRGEFTRVLTLPTEVDSARAKASFKDGMLELTLPKIQPTQRRSIKVE